MDKKNMNKKENIEVLHLSSEQMAEMTRFDEQPKKKEPFQLKRFMKDVVLPSVAFVAVAAVAVYEWDKSLTRVEKAEDEAIHQRLDMQKEGLWNAFTNGQMSKTQYEKEVKALNEVLEKHTHLWRDVCPYADKKKKER